MSAEIVVPELGESIVEVTVQRWLKHEGERVDEGDPIVELETEKANVEIPARQSGVLASIHIGEGVSAAVGAVLGVIRIDSNAKEPVTATLSAEPSRRDDQIPNGDADEEAEHSHPSASPGVRRLASEHAVDLASIHGTGERGRVTREDVLGHMESASKPATPARAARLPAAPIPQPAPTSSSRETRRRMSTRRRTIARRLVEAQQTAAMLTTFNEADMSAIIELRRRRNEEFMKRHGLKLGFMSFFAKAVVGALREFPYLNAEIDGDDVILKQYYDIGIAVGVPEGLVVPVVRDMDCKSFAQIEREIADLATRARENNLGLADLRGGTFTITNGGVYGSLMSTPILNTPQVGILGMHATKERPVVVAGEIVVRPMMYLALTYDHRIVDGSDAVRFLVRVKSLVEDPETLLLEG